MYASESMSGIFGPFYPESKGAECETQAIPQAGLHNTFPNQTLPPSANEMLYHDSPVDQPEKQQARGQRTDIFIAHRNHDMTLTLHVHPRHAVYPSPPHPGSLVHLHTHTHPFTRGIGLIMQHIGSLATVFRLLDKGAETPLCACAEVYM